MSLCKTIKIVIADDQEFFRNGFKNIIQSQYPDEIEFIAEAANGVELIECVEKLRPQLVITDIKMPIMDGIKACRIIKEKYPETSIIAISIFEDAQSVMEMLQAGVNGYMVKTTTKEEVINAIRTVSSGQPYFCSTVSEKVFRPFINGYHLKQKGKKIQFSPQELKIAKLICNQHTIKEIASKMKLCTRTVEDYRYNMQEKIGAKNVVGVAIYAVINEIVKLSELNV